MKVLVIGLGSIGRKHVSAIKSIQPDAVIYAYRSNKEAEIFLDVINIYSYCEVPEDIDFVIISNITSLHETTIYEVLPFDCPLFIEKPVLSNLSNAASISKDIKERKLITYVACNLRFHPAVRFIKEYLAMHNPRINEVNVYAGSYLPDWRPRKNFKDTYSAHEDMGGGVHLDLIHELDYCTWVFGFPQSVSSIKRSVSSLKINSIDSARYFLKYNDYSIDIGLNYFRRDTKRVIEILTDKDTIEADLIKNEVISIKNNEQIFKSEFTILDTYRDQMQYFIEMIQHKRSPMNDFENAVKVLEIAIHE